MKLCLKATEPKSPTYDKSLVPYRGDWILETCIALYATVDFLRDASSRERSRLVVPIQI